MPISQALKQNKGTKRDVGHLFTKARVEGWPWAAPSLPPSRTGEKDGKDKDRGHLLITITGQTEMTSGKLI